MMMPKGLLSFLCVAMCLSASVGETQEQVPEPVSVAAKVEIWRHSRLELVRKEQPDRLQPFTTDGCSGGMSAAWEALATYSPWFYEVFEERAPWHDCCVTHDRTYHLGGSTNIPEHGYVERLQADEALRSCVQDVAKADSATLARQYGRDAEEIEAVITFVSHRMFDAVRLGGWPCSGLSWRWGYGWPQCW